MEVFFRKATLQDAERLAHLASQLGYPTEKAQMHGRLHEVLNRDDNFVLVATAQKTIIGWVHAFVSLRIESDSFTEIGGMVVDEHHRQNGIGRLMLAEVCKWALSKNCFSVRVRSNSKRSAAHNFYVKNGFLSIKEQKVFSYNLANS